MCIHIHSGGTSEIATSSAKAARLRSPPAAGRAHPAPAPRGWGCSGSRRLAAGFQHQFLSSCQGLFHWIQLQAASLVRASVSAALGSEPAQRCDPGVPPVVNALRQDLQI